MAPMGCQYEVDAGWSERLGGKLSRHRVIAPSGDRKTTATVDGVAAAEWWAREDSNLQPIDYEPTALTVELRAPLCC